MKIAILGFSETMKQAPFDDPSWTFWGMNGLWRVKPADVPESRFALWFELHTPEFIAMHEKASNIGSAQTDWLKAPHPFPVMMQERYPEFPAAVWFPIEDVLAAGRDYLTSSVALELAYALSLSDISEIGLWGIDLVHGTEWGHQRPCAEYWIGLAEGRGIKITVPETSALLSHAYRYAYADPNPLVGIMRASLDAQAKAAAAKVVELQAQHEKSVAEMHTNDGAYQAMQVIAARLDAYERGQTQ